MVAFGEMAKTLYYRISMSVHALSGAIGEQPCYRSCAGSWRAVDPTRTPWQMLRLGEEAEPSAEQMLK
jgi:hypothetical protein